MFESLFFRTNDNAFRIESFFSLFEIASLCPFSNSLLLELNVSKSFIAPLKSPSAFSAKIDNSDSSNLIFSNSQIFLSICKTSFVFNGLKPTNIHSFLKAFNLSE